MVSLKARQVSDFIGPKDVAPSGFNVTELVFADRTARSHLAQSVVVDGAEKTRRRRWAAWITEGLPDFLTAATAIGDADDDPPAVFGVFSGSWSRAFADRVTDGASIAVDVHADDAGAAYRRDIARSFAGRDVRLFDVHRGDH
jgi:hypothetical protein